MKFTEEQVEKVSALREELAAKVSMYSSGRQHAVEIIGGDRVKSWVWIDDLCNDIRALEIEEKTVLDTEIENLDEMDFYILLGRYFQKLEEDVEKAEKIAQPAFYSLIKIYQTEIKKALN